MLGEISRRIDPRRSLRARLTLALGATPVAFSAVACLVVGATIRGGLPPEAAPLIDAVQRLIIGLGAVGGVLAALAGWALADRVATSLGRLADSMERFRRGERSPDVPASMGHDEVGALARVLADFLRAVGGEERELRRAVVARDLEARERSAELRALSVVAERTDHAVVITDCRGHAEWVNDAFTRLSGYPLDEVRGRQPSELLHCPETDVDVAAHVASCIERGEGYSVDMLHRAKGGRLYWMSADVRPIRDEQGALTNFVVIGRETTVRRQEDDRLRRAALHDPLTDLPNRVLFHDRMAHAARRATREPADGFGVLLVDLDGFGAVNDSLGQAAGDELLGRVARQLEGNVRPGDSVARLGGDEFAILLEHLTSAADATCVADRILARLREPVTVGGHVVTLSGSIGIALSGAGGVSFEDTLRGADAAMVRAKAQGKNRYVIYDAVQDGPALALGPRRSAPPGSGRRAS